MYKIIFGQHILLKLDHYLVRIVVLNIYYVWSMFSQNMHGLNLWTIKKLKHFFMVFFIFVVGINIHHYPIGNKPIDADYSALKKEIESSHKTPNFKAGDRLGITKYKNMFSKAYIKNFQKKYLWLILHWELMLGYISFTWRNNSRKLFWKRIVEQIINGLLSRTR